MPVLSVVIPAYNEQDVLPLLYERLRPVCDGLHVDYEVLVVDDGSTDQTAALLLRYAREWPQLRVVRLRANAGHQAAISAGLDLARGDYMVTLDADLQDPPEVIAKMLEVARKHGVDVVYGVRTDRSTDTAFKRLTARWFYSVIRKLSGTTAESDAGDFRMMSRATVDALNTLPHHNRVIRFAVPALGFPSAAVGYKRQTRAAGESKYPFMKMVKLSVDSLTGFSIAPLRLATLLGLLTGVFALGMIAYAIVSLITGHALAGWTSTISIVSLLGAVQLLCVGMLGEYIGRIFAALQARPTYFVGYDTLTDTVPAHLTGQVREAGELDAMPQPQDPEEPQADEDHREADVDGTDFDTRVRARAHED